MLVSMPYASRASAGTQPRVGGYVKKMQPMIAIGLKLQLTSQLQLFRFIDTYLSSVYGFRIRVLLAPRYLGTTFFVGCRGGYRLSRPFTLVYSTKKVFLDSRARLSSTALYG